MKAPNMISAATGWLAHAAARALRPGYRPSTCAPGGEALSAAIELAYNRAVVEGYQSMRQLMGKPSKKNAKATLGTGDIASNVHSVGAQFAKAAATLDPDGIASEIVRLFCVGVPHMDDLGNQRRVVTVWSALLAPAVVMREKAGREIPLDSLVGMALHWLVEGSTAAAKDAHASPDTRFISAHPARVYELLTDTAHAHGLDHMKLMASVIEPVVLPLGQYIGARQAAAGVHVQDLSEEPQQEGSE